jgi:hypothetical protein
MSVPRAIARLLFGGRPPARMLDGFADSLVQTFENCRSGLSDEALRNRAVDVEPFFRALYEKERPRLRELVRLQDAHLSEAARQDLLGQIEARIQDVLIPAYARLAQRFTVRERNDFYGTPGAWHAAERVAFAALGMALGLFCIRAPFIPLWAKEWVLIFAIGGLVFPELRRVLATRRYQAELNGLVQRTDDEIFRMDLALLTLGAAPGPAVVDRPQSESAAGPAPRVREGGGR